MKSTLSISVLILAISLLIDFESIDVAYVTFRFFHHLFTLYFKLVPDPIRPNLSAEFRSSEILLQYRHKVPLDLNAEPLAMVKKVRDSFRIDLAVPFPSGCQIQREIYGYADQEVETYWIDYRTTQNHWDSNRLLLYFHGGGYAVGGIHVHRGLACHLSRYFNLTVLHVEYRLVPEHPLPAAVDDALLVYEALLRHGYSSSHVIVLGDSAGGGLALLFVQALLIRGISPPGAVITLSPWTDLSLSSHSYTRNRQTDVVLDMNEILPLIELIFGPKHHQIPRNHSAYSPLFGSFKNFPPMFISIGTAEVLEDDGRRVADKAQSEGVDVTLDVGEHMIHDYPIFFQYFPEAKKTIESIGRWLLEKVDVHA